MDNENILIYAVLLLQVNAMENMTTRLALQLQAVGKDLTDAQRTQAEKLVNAVPSEKKAKAALRA